MIVRVSLSLFLIFIGFSTTFIECRKCVNSATSHDDYRACPAKQPKCCGLRRHGHRSTCEKSCVNFRCETNRECGGLACCNGHCSASKNCLPVTTWGVVGIAIVSLFVVLAMFRACHWCRKRNKVLLPDNTTSTISEAPINRVPFVVSDFENHGFLASMAPPPYDIVVQNDRSRSNDQPPQCNLNLQTIMNNSSSNSTASNNFVHEVNISIVGSTMFNNDFPPSYFEINRDINSPGEDNVGQAHSSSEGNAESFQGRGTLGFGDEPPPYTPPNNTDSSMEEDSTLNHENSSEEEIQTVSSSAIETDIEQPVDHHSNVREETVHSSEATGEMLNSGAQCLSGNEGDNDRN